MSLHLRYEYQEFDKSLFRLTTWRLQCRKTQHCLSKLNSICFYLIEWPGTEAWLLRRRDITVLLLLPVLWSNAVPDCVTSDWCIQCRTVPFIIVIIEKECHCGDNDLLRRRSKLERCWLKYWTTAKRAPTPSNRMCLPCPADRPWSPRPNDSD